MHIAVRDLVAFVLRRGDLQRAFTGPSRAVEAIRAHQRIQRSRPPGYQAEVPVSTEVIRGDVLLMVAGRIDGVFERKGAVVIEEIKTTIRDRGQLMIQAATGIGKTMGVIFPAVKALGEGLCDRISTLYRQRRSTAAAVAGMIAALVSARRGNYLVFFPSYEYLELVHAACLPALSGARLMVQQSGMDEDRREAFVAAFRQRRDDTLVGFAVLGGVFGEGIDLVGDRLIGVVVVGVGLPGICQERELINA